MQKEVNFFIKSVSVLQISIIIFAIFSMVVIIADSNRVSAGHTWWHFWVDSPPAEVSKPGANGVEQGIVSDIYSGKIFGATPGTIPSALIQGVAWGLTAFIALKMITGLLGVDDNTANAISAAGGAGFTDY